MPTPPTALYQRESAPARPPRRGGTRRSAGGLGERQRDDREGGAARLAHRALLHLAAEDGQADRAEAGGVDRRGDPPDGRALHGHLGARLDDGAVEADAADAAVGVAAV